MKNIYTVLALLICTIIQAQIVNIPDANFKNALLNHNPVIDTNGDGEIQISEAEVVLQMNVRSQNISSLEGIQYFRNLSELDGAKNQITNLDLSQNHNITSLWLHNNQIADLNLNNLTKLWWLMIFENVLINLDVSDCLELEWVFASNNRLESFDISQIPKVMYLELQRNNLFTLNIAGGHTYKLTLVDGRDNPNLGCIQVDDVNYARTRYCTRDFWCIGPPFNPNAYYSEDCSLSSAEFSRVNFSIYPNPVKDVLAVKSQEPINLIKIYSITGKMLKKTTESSINVSEFASGIYFVVVSINGRSDTQKFIKS